MLRWGNHNNYYIYIYIYIFICPVQVPYSMFLNSNPVRKSVLPAVIWGLTFVYENWGLGVRVQG